MTTQTEAQLEENFINRLCGAGYKRVEIKDSAALLTNLKKQIEKHNEVKLTDDEFKRVLNYLDKGGIFERANLLRDGFHIKRKNGNSKTLRFLNTEEWCKNEFQVTNQVTVEGQYKNRYDVTILVNGLPLVQIELKRRGVEMKEAFNQVKRYQKHSYGAQTVRGLFQYIQIFIISNGVNTKYFANNPKQSFKQTFNWAQKNNEYINPLMEFADTFLEPCHIAKMICRYTVLQETDKILMVLRPYQYYAVEAIVERVKNCRENGYIWHTTGSGKTLTSFKAAQILTKIPKVHKVVFVVDRVDLDYQTMTEFNKFSAGSVDGTENTAALVKQFGDTTQLIVTTIQKLNNAISGTRHKNTMKDLADKRVVFIFDECHRSQFGDTHQRIKTFFSNAQMFGFTGTPIFEDNAISSKAEEGKTKRTTIDLFTKRLHTYVIPDAIRDENVLKFSIEYWGKLKLRDGSLIDEEVAGINTKEIFGDAGRIGNIVDWIARHHKGKTHNGSFTAILAVGSIDTLIKYYDAFKEKRTAGTHDLNVATIFSYAANEEDKNADGGIAEADISGDVNKNLTQHSREKLDEYIDDYNTLYGTSFSTNRDGGFYDYYKDIGRRIKGRERDSVDDENPIDILLVVNMFLTGFDAKKVNTLYVDKNLKHHGLIQAFSRTNRIINETKSQGNIVCFRNLKAASDEALAMFSDKQSVEDILVEPYEDCVTKFNNGVKKLLEIAPDVSSVDTLPDEEAELRFIKAFRNLMRILNVLQSFSEFSWGKLQLSEQGFNDYKSKYLDLHEKSRRTNEDERVSIIQDVNFELELIQRDEINVKYIIDLLAGSIGKGKKKEKQIRQMVEDLLGNEVHLRSKRELIQKFIDEYMHNFETADEMNTEFTKYWNRERELAVNDLRAKEKLDGKRLNKIINDYGSKIPTGEVIVESLETPPKILERRLIIDRIKIGIKGIVHTFDENTGALV